MDPGRVIQAKRQVAACPMPPSCRRYHACIVVDRDQAVSRMRALQHRRQRAGAAAHIDDVA